MLRGQVSVLFKRKEHRALWSNTKREIKVISRKLIAVPLYLSQIPHGQAWETARYYGKLLSPLVLSYYLVDKNML
jgi:hypothetical protein